MGARQRRTQDRPQASPTATVVAKTSTSTREDAQHPERNSGRWQVLGAAILIMVGRRVVGAMTGPQTFISCFPEQPLFTTTPDFLPREAFMAIQEEVQGHRYMGGNALNAENFQRTEGFVVKFNKEGVDSLKSDSSLAALSDYFDRTRDASANAWVLNVLLCMPGGTGGDLGGGGIDGGGGGGGEKQPLPLSVSPHVDETLGTSSRDYFMAHVVNVLYVSIPEDMSGGRLEMYSYGWLRATMFPYLLSFLTTPQLDRVLPPDASVDPVENLLVSFRGDTIHRVEGYRTAGGSGSGERGGEGVRVSVVLEQYSVPLLSYGLTTVYDLSAGSQHQKREGPMTNT